MSDPYGPRDDRTRSAGQPDHDRAHDAANASNAAESRAPDAWAEVYGNRPPPDWPTKRRSLRGLAWTLSLLIPVVAINEASYAFDYFTRTPEVIDQGGFYFWVNYGFFYPLTESALHMVSLLAVLVTAGLFVAWQYKHAKNAQVLGQRGGLGPGWAIGAWFIPFANLILPAVQLAQSSRASDPPPGRYRGESRTALVVWWAVAFALSLLEISFASSEPATVATADMLTGLLTMFSIPAALLAVVMIWQLTTRQERALDARGL